MSLVDDIRSGKIVEPEGLTYAAEPLGCSVRPLPDGAIDLLISLLGHESPVVREGAVYGLAPHVTNEAVRSALLSTSLNDSSPAVCESAREALQ